MTKLFSQFTERYSLSKTLRFELKPVAGFDYGEFINSRTFKSDIMRAEAYPKVREIIDAYHRRFIDTSLIKATFDWSPLHDAIISRRRAHINDDDSKQILKSEQSIMRVRVADLFRQHKDWNYISRDHKKFMDEVLPKFVQQRGYDNSSIEVFKGFTVYFFGFHRNRLNMYSEKEQKTAVAYRIVNENFPNFIDNMIVYNGMKDRNPRKIATLKRTIAVELKGQDLDKIFSLEYFNSCLTQMGIERYNAVVNMIAQEASGIKGFKGISAGSAKKDQPSANKGEQLKMRRLFKQILSDKEDTVNYMFSSDEEVKSGLANYYAPLNESGLDNIITSMNLLKDCDHDKIYIRGKYFNKISEMLFGRWNLISDNLKSQPFPISDSPRSSNTESKPIESRLFTLTELIDIVDEIAAVEGNSNLDLCNWVVNNTEVLADAIRHSYQTHIVPLLDKGVVIKDNPLATSNIKLFLDNCVNFRNFIRIFHLGKSEIELDKDPSFYTIDLDEAYQNLSTIKYLYDNVRNYLSLKLLDHGKIKLKFGNPTLANGWDKNKEADNSVVILMRDNMYYLAIMSTAIRGANRSFTTIPKTKEGDDVYKKMNYKLLPGPSKMLPKVFFCDKGIKMFRVPDEILVGYRAEQHKKTNGNMTFCYKLIDFYKRAINQREDWRFFDFEFKPTDQYRDIGEFYRDVERQGYKITFEDVPTSYIEQLVADKKLFLFQIYSKDFSPHSKGMPNLHTLYWKSLFSDENLQNVVFKLNGDAEIFYRKSIRKKTIVHHQGSMLVNRCYQDGSTIPNDIYVKLCLYFNGELQKHQLTDNDLAAAGRAVVKEASIELIKDKRYTNFKFLLHVPITINFRSGKPNKFNDMTNELLAKYDGNINVIGIDRGEKNLLCMVMIDHNGNIVKQMSFNSIASSRYDGGESIFDYNTKLLQMENDDKTSASNWGKIDNIKDVKDGYLSQVVHQIAKLIVEERAVVVMEDMNANFRRGQFKLTSDHYIRFQKMLVDKLNYLVIKSKKQGAASVMAGLQLTPPCENIKISEKQMGWLYYVPANFISKICPKTGFINVFDLKNVRSKESIRAFFAAMNSIVYNDADSVFEFDFDYDKFKTNHCLARSRWTVCTIGNRIRTIKTNDSKWDYEEIDITSRMKQILDQKHIEYTKGEDIKHLILAVEIHHEELFYEELLEVFLLTLQMCNAKHNDHNHYLISPVRDKHGRFFDSRNAISVEPTCPDANSAYHMAIKGLILLNRIRNRDRNMMIKNEDWFSHRQSDSV